MNTCLIHMQLYPLGCHCPYCGPPQSMTVSTTSTNAKECATSEYVMSREDMERMAEFTTDHIIRSVRLAGRAV